MILGVLALIFIGLTAWFTQALGTAWMDDAILPPDVDPHNNPEMWSLTGYHRRVAAKRRQAWLVYGVGLFGLVLIGVASAGLGWL